MLKKILILLLLSSLFSCGFQVLYKEDASENKEKDFSYENELAAIRIKKNRTKLDQDLKNNLYDLLNPNFIEAEPKYFLSLITSKTTASTFTSSTGASGRNRVFLSVSYELRDLKNGDLISEGSVTRNDNYDVTQNRYATYSADEYVMLNLTKIVAQNIRDSLVNDLIELRKKQEEEKTKVKD
ncbi:MAG: hypothetical protein EBS06_00380 [Proteobacteria bacterium]|nr:hypothetical protein [Pseudomonadota bacterium]